MPHTEAVIIAVGSNVGDRHRHLRNAYTFLQTLSAHPVRHSAIYLTEPVGPSRRYFLNAAVEITTPLAPKALLSELKKFEREHGRSSHHPKWNPRTIDLDIICFGDLVIQHDSLIIPHPDYDTRLFVLKPLQDIAPDWRDPGTGKAIDTMIKDAPALHLKKTTLTW